MHARPLLVLTFCLSIAAAACGGGSSSTGSGGSAGRAGAGGGKAGAGGGKAGTGGGKAGAGGGDAGAGGSAGNAGSLAGGGAGGSGPQTVAVSGTVTGLVGAGLTLSDGLGHQETITADGAFVFDTRVAVGADVAVTVTQQPTTPTQTCTVTGGTISAIGQDTDVAVVCTTNRYHVGGMISGLLGTGLVLQNNAGDDLPVTENGSFSFATTVASGATFTVAVKTQPTGPAQTCQLSAASGTVGATDVTGVVINCGINTFTVGGTISGLAGTGLVLQNNGGNDLAVTTGGMFAFTAPVASGGAFAVTVKTQPSGPMQTCAVSQGSGTVANGSITTVAITCVTKTFAVGGTVAGLTGSGLVLQNNLGDNLTVAEDGPVTFGTQVASGAPYAVTVLTNPSSPAQTCTIASASGLVSAAAVNDIAVTCTTNKYSVGGVVVGLTGSGLILRNDGADLPVAASGPFTFPTQQLSGSAFGVTIATQPSNPAQTCMLSGATGSVGGANVTSVTVNCSTDQHVVSGAVTGLAGAGLALSLNGGTPLAVGADGGFSFSAAVASGEPYAVTVTTQPQTPWQTCTVANGSGTIGSTDVANVAVTCVTNSYKIGGSVTGLAGTGLVLRDNGGGDLAINTDGTFQFAASLASGAGYAVTVATQPQTPWQTCIVVNGTGAVSGGDITSVAVTCNVDRHPVAGIMTGLSGTVVLQNNGGDNLVLTSNGSFAFPTTLPSGGTYAITVQTQPTNPYQTCAVTMGTGTVTNAAITDIRITCVTNKYTIGGTVIGLVGGNMVLQNNAGDDLVLGPTGSFVFPTAINSGTSFAVTIKTQPSAPTQTCSVGGGTGTVGNANVGTVTINCSTNAYLVGGTVSGLFGGGLILQNNAGGDISLAGSGTFTFASPVLSGAGYAVTVKTQPTNPWQTCTPTGGSGTVTNANVSVPIACVSNPYAIKAVVTGLMGSGLVLQNNAGDNLSIPGVGTHTFATSIKSGLTYAVTVLSQPTGPSQTCTVTSPSGAVAGGPVTLAVNCVTNSYTVSGTVTGLNGTGLKLRNNGGDDKTVSANGAFTFATEVASGGAYAVSVATQPSTPAQSCIVSNGSGTVGAGPVTGVTVACANVATCATASENATLTLTCPAGRKILSIDFASYGLPTGMCGSYQINSSCHSATSVSFMTTQCVNQQSCTVSATNANFGDPCYGSGKWLWVQASCS
jgi:hypothetical protein